MHAFLSTLVAFAPAVEAPAGQGTQALLDVAHLAPMMIVGLWSLLHLAADAFSGTGMRGFQRRLALVGLALGAATILYQVGDTQYDAGVKVFSGFLVVDQFSLLLDLGILVVAAATVMFAGDYARSHRFEYGEQEALLLIATFGIMVLNHAGNLLALFLGIETMSIAVYVLVGARWNSRRSPEAALKYFVMGAFASGLLVMGMALLYGATGTISLHELGLRVSQLLSGGQGSWQSVAGDVDALTAGELTGQRFDAVRDRVIVGFAPAALMIPGVLLTLGAVLFKISAVPFHMWTPDAYDGAPTPTTAFMAAGVKIGGFAALLRLFVSALDIPRVVQQPYGWATVVSVIALLTMTVGNLAAVRQSNVKRLLAYSSVAHVGYLLVGVVAAARIYTHTGSMGPVKAADQVQWSQDTGDLAVATVLFYVLTYAIATLGTFACVAFYGANKREATGTHEWAGMAQRHPGVALAMTICLLSLMGMPPMAGFIGKLGIFRVALESGNSELRYLVIAALLNSVVGAYYYLRLIVAMYFRAPPETEVVVLPSRGARAVLALAAGLSVVLGIGADTAMRRCEVAAAGFAYPAGSSTKAERVAALRTRWAAEDAASDTPDDAETDEPEPGENAEAAAAADEGKAADPAPAAAAPDPSKIKKFPGKVVPARAAPGKAGAGKAAPGKPAPGAAVPDKAAPGQAAPDQAAPGQASPDKAAPGQAAPGQVAPGQGAPRGAGPGKAAAPGDKPAAGPGKPAPRGDAKPPVAPSPG